MNILISDEQLNGVITNQFEIDIKESIISTKELIELRVNQEVESYNKKLPEYFTGLIEPNEAEKTLNGFRLKKKQLIDVEKQVYIALDAFQKNGFFILVDDKQIENLVEQISIRQNTRISFIKLTPLIGG